MALALWLLALAGAVFWLHTRHNDFPYHYHPDEGGKVMQVQTGRWNFNHPMLLLSTANAAVEMRGASRDPQTIVEAGRTVSAGFTALAVAALALLAWFWRGWPASLAAGGALLLHHQLFELAHYMKEDSALLLGMALTFLAAIVHTRKPSTGAVLFLGIACALAISGKYLGVLALGVAGPLLWRAPATQRWKWTGCFAAALAGTFILVNLPLFTQLATFRQSLDREVGLVVGGQGGLTRSVPHAQYWNIFVDNTTPAIWVLLLVFLHARWRERRSLVLAEWMIIAFPFAYALALSCSPKSNDRYFLPATALFTLLAALGVQDAARLLAPWFRPSRAAAFIAAVLIAAQLPSFTRYWLAFQNDDTAEVTAWLRAAQEVPAAAVIARDERVSLPEPRDPAALPQKVLASRYAADIGSLDELRAKGVTHVVISESNYGRFFLKSLRPQEKEKEKADFARRKAFHEELLRAVPPIRLLFERPRGTVIYLHPGIRVYRIVGE